MIILKGKRKEIFELIKSSPKDIAEVKILVKPSKKLFFYILKYLPNIQRIYVSEGIYKTISKKIVAALNRASVEVVVFSAKVGRPEVFPSSKKNQALELIKQNLPAKQISQSTALPLSTIYFLRKKYKNRL
ncbi:MAG: hypothetical protein QXV83_03675 [Candidatus Anstonellaceae archaeon]